MILGVVSTTSDLTANERLAVKSLMVALMPDEIAYATKETFDLVSPLASGWGLSRIGSLQGIDQLLVLSGQAKQIYMVSSTGKLMQTTMSWSAI